MPIRKTETQTKRQPAPGAAVETPQLQQLALDALIPYARNSRTHSDEQVAQIAASIREFGFTNPVLVDADNGIIAGHGRVLAARKLGLATVPVLRIDYLSEAQKRAYVIADNKLALNAGWDEELLALELGELNELGVDLALTGFSEEELAGLRLGPADEVEGLTDEDETPEPQADAVSVAGDVWILGEHRVMCGNSLAVTDVERLMAGETARLLHADPPYGMGKEGDGVANDNLYGEDLDQFQLGWWATYRTFLANNASAYVWGNAPDLWRLWYAGGLGASETLVFCNEIVWDKTFTPGMAAEASAQYQTASERCLFFQLGQKYRGNVNNDDFPETWEPLRAWLAAEAEAAGITADTVRQLCGVGMHAKWFTRSQFVLMPRKHYETLAAAFPGRFVRPWTELKAEWDVVKSGPTQAVQAARAHFDNTHDAMTDVWRFPRVTGDDRHGHATPKPVEMMARIMRSSLPKGGLVAEPFGGSGSTLMAAHRTGRRCFTMELQPHYVDVIVRRWQAFTGQQAVLEGSGQSFDELAAARAPGDAGG